MKLLFILTLLVSTQAFSSNFTTFESPFFHEKTITVIKKMLNKKKLKVFSVIDHHKGAKKVKLNLDKTSLIIFGNPKVGTLLMQENQLLGLALPLKLLVHTHGKVTKISHIKIDVLKKEYQLSSKLDSLLAKIKMLYEDISTNISLKDIKAYD